MSGWMRLMPLTMARMQAVRMLMPGPTPQCSPGLPMVLRSSTKKQASARGSPWPGAGQDGREVDARAQRAEAVAPVAGQA